MVNVHVIVLHRATYLRKIQLLEKVEAESQPITALFPTYSSLMAPKHFIFLLCELREN